MKKILDQLYSDLHDKSIQIENHPEPDLESQRDNYKKFDILKEKKSSLEAALCSLSQIEEYDSEYKKYDDSGVIHEIQVLVKETEQQMENIQQKISIIQELGIKFEKLNEDLNNIQSAIKRLEEYQTVTEIIPLKTEVDPWAF